MSPQIALMAAIMGGLLFLMLFLILGCCLVRRAKRKTEKDRLRTKEAPIFNGWFPNTVIITNLYINVDLNIKVE